jgi:hypothetical protein
MIGGKVRQKILASSRPSGEDGPKVVNHGRLRENEEG